MEGSDLKLDPSESSSQKQFNRFDLQYDEQLVNRPSDDHRSDDEQSNGDYQSTSEQSNKSNQENPNDSKRGLSENTKLKDVSKMTDDEKKSTNQLLQELDKNAVGQQKDESSLNESLNGTNLSEKNHKEMSLESDQKEVSQEELEFVKIFDNPDLLKRTLKKGDESQLKPEKNCEVLINLEVRNQETGELIESECEQNLSILIGDFDVLRGVDLALLTMYKGEIAEILVKPLLSYGPEGKQPDIPPNCSLLCKVELIKITWPNERVCPNLNALFHYFRMTKRKKERGNFFFKRQEFTTALHCYVKSGELLDFLGEEMISLHNLLTDCQSKLTDEERKKEMADELAQINDLSVQYMKIKLDVFNNLSLVSLKMKLYKQALDYVTNALLIEPTDKKALLRKSIILSHRGSVEEAMKTLTYALKLDPKNKTFLDELSKLKVKLKKQIKEEKALCVKMFQVNKKKGKKEKQSNNRSLNYLAAGLVIGGVVLGVVFVYRKLIKS